MDSFYLNGYLWQVRIVPADDKILTDRTGKHTVAVTDPTTYTVYLSAELGGDFLITVLLHELGHCTIISFGLDEEIRRVVYPKYWIEAEEWVCNFIADYGAKIFTIAYHTLGYEAWKYVPKELEKFIA